MEEKNLMLDADLQETGLENPLEKINLMDEI